MRSNEASGDNEVDVLCQPQQQFGAKVNFDRRRGTQGAVTSSEDSKSTVRKESTGGGREKDSYKSDDTVQNFVLTTCSKHQRSLSNSQIHPSRYDLAKSDFFVRLVFSVFRN